MIVVAILHVQILGKNTFYLRNNW